MTERRSEQQRESTRVALSMVRADWQGDEQSARRLWRDCDDHEALARELARLCRETMERLATAAGVSTGEMLHRQSLRLLPPGTFQRAPAGDEAGGGSVGHSPEQGVPER